MEPVFACNVSLYLRLVDPIYASPCEGPTYNNRPEGVPLQRIGIKARKRGKREKKSEYENLLVRRRTLWLGAKVSSYL